MAASRTANSIMEEFRWRGLIHVTEDGQELYTTGLEEVLAGKKVTGYIGFDPSADSLHIGNLLGIMMLMRLQRHGHRPIAIAGGGTGLIGDPGGKSVERPLLTREALAENLQGIRAQLARFLDFDAGENAAMLINNADWLEPTGAIDFMRDVGKHFTVNYMLAKDSVQGRMADGITYTEFSYMLLQAYDYLTLYDRYGCTLQMGGSDQWGNITAGVHLVRRVRDAQVHALVTPLVTSASGAKFGKTEAGAVWLDADKTSPFQYYQFWLNSQDADVVKLLRYFTLLPREEIAELEQTVAKRPEGREAQRRLAAEATRMTHGEPALQKALTATEALFRRGRVGADGGGAAGRLPGRTLRHRAAPEVRGRGRPAAGAGGARGAGALPQRGAAAHTGRGRGRRQPPGGRPAARRSPGGRRRRARDRAAPWARAQRRLVRLEG